MDDGSLENFPKCVVKKSSDESVIETIYGKINELSEKELT